MPHVHTFASKAVFNFSFQACFALMVPFAGYIYKNQLHHVSESFPNRKLIHVLSSEMSNSLQPCTLGAIKQGGRDWKSSCTRFHCVFFMGMIFWRKTGVESDASRRPPESQVSKFSSFSLLLLFLLPLHCPHHELSPQCTQDQNIGLTWRARLSKEEGI